MAVERFQVSPHIPEPARQLLSVLRGQTKYSKQQCIEMIQAGAVRLNGRVCTKSFYRLAPNDWIEYDWNPQPILARKPAKSSTSTTFRIVHDDSDLVVVLKPANLLTVPTMQRESRTLLTMLTRHLQRTNPSDQAYCVHRLDRGVSGLLVFAKSLTTAEAMRDQFAARKPERRYVAICRGHFTRRKGTIRSYLATDDDLNRYSTAHASEGQLAITHYTVKEEWEEASLLEIQLETGRRNQIRVHLAEASHPILGDPRYRATLAEHWAWPHRRLALHAESLSFTHPRTGRKLSFRSSWPEEFREFKRRTAHE